MNLRPLATWFLAAASVAAVAASPQFGLTLTASKPQGDLGATDAYDGKIEYGLGAQLSLDLSPSVVLVPRFDVTRYSRTRSMDYRIPGYFSVRGSAESKATLFFLGADVQVFPGGPSASRFYFLAGLGYVSGKFEGSGDMTSFGPGGVMITQSHISDSRTHGSVYGAAGFGLRFSRQFSAEARYIGLDKFTDGDSTVSAPSLNVSCVFKF